MQRLFTSGSRQTPDPYDQHLEDHGYFRKHIPRDPSCLFRAISEQLYDSQNHHSEIRKRCVEYLKKHRSYFEPGIENMTFEEYVEAMESSHTHGTIIELAIVGFMYQRNVLIFKPYDTGSWFSFQKKFEGNDVFRVFTANENHFDSVFTSEYITTAAMCQSLVYEVLYSDFFKIPDVRFTVERMLHSSSMEGMEFENEYNDDGYCTKLTFPDGREFTFDLPEDTNCILEDFQLCHFHNPEFPQFVESLKNSLEPHGKNSELRISSFLPDKHVSCVRQLLQEGITPFPYKVAKALDPYMYRNIEFDSWSEVKKENRLKNWYMGGTNFQVGVKCHVKLRKSQAHPYTCHIQEMPNTKDDQCLVYIEELGGMYFVPYDYLKPLPEGEAKPWALPVRLQRAMEKYNMYKTRSMRTYRAKARDYAAQSHEYCMADYIEECAGEDSKNDCYFKFKRYTQLRNFRTQTIEYCTMPLTVEHDKKEGTGLERTSGENLSEAQHNPADGLPQSESQEDPSNAMGVPSELCSSNYGYTDQYYGFSYDGSGVVPAVGPTGVIPPCPPVFYMCNATYPQPNNVFVPGHPPPPMTALAPSQNYQVPTVPSMSVVQRRGGQMTPLSGRINYDARESVQVSGKDLPSDIQTLRYFYNLGLEYYKIMKERRDPQQTTERDGSDVLTSDMQKMKLEENGNQQESKSDSNNNYHSNGNQNQPRKFHARYFNRKDRGGGHRGGNAGRYQQMSGGKHFNRTNTPTAPPSNRSSCASPLVVAEQGIQTSPMIQCDVNDTSQTSPMPNQMGYPPYYQPDGIDYSQQLFVPMAGPPPQLPMGMYTVPPPALTTVSPGGTQGTYPTYMGPPAIASYPPQSGPGQMPPPGSSVYYHGEGGPMPVIGSASSEGLDGGHYPYMNYAPMYYPNGSIVPSSVGHQIIPPPGNMAPQGLWCFPPPTQQCQTSSGNSSTQNSPPSTSQNNSANNVSH